MEHWRIFYCFNKTTRLGLVCWKHLHQAINQYLCNFIYDETLCEFETICDKIGSTTNMHLNQIILGLIAYPFPVNAVSKKNRTMQQGMINTHKFKVRSYAAHTAELNEYLAIFTGSKEIEKWERRNLMKLYFTA